MEHLDALAKILAITGSFLLGMRWVVKRIESGQSKLHKGQQKLRRELASKVDISRCRQLRYAHSGRWVRKKQLAKAS